MVYFLNTKSVIALIFVTLLLFGGWLVYIFYLSPKNESDVDAPLAEKKLNNLGRKQIISDQYATNIIYQNSKDLENDENEFDYEYELSQSEECKDLKTNNPTKLQYYYDLDKEYGLGREDLMTETSYNNLGVKALIPLAEGGDLKAKMILGISYVWSGSIGIDYFSDLIDTDSDESQPNLSKVAKEHQLDLKKVRKGQGLLWDAGIQGKYFSLLELIIAERFVLNKYAKSNDYGAFKIELDRYLELVQLVNYVFDENSKALIDEFYYEESLVISNLKKNFPNITKDIDFENSSKSVGDRPTLIDKWKEERYQNGFLDTSFNIDRNLVSFSKKMNIHCSGI